jgi:hypothetical protein
MVIDKKWREFVTITLLSIFAWFTLININERVGLVYGVGCGILLVVYYAIYDKYPDKIIAIETKTTNRILEIAIAVGAYVAFIIVAGFVMSILSPTTTTSYVDTVNSFIGQTFSATPVLAGSNTLKTWTWGDVIPIVETVLFFTVLISLILTLTKYTINTKFTDGGLWLIIILVSLIYTLAWVFMVFHSEAKGITNNPALIVTFIFGVISLILVFWRKTSFAAIILHIITNTIGMMKLLTTGFYASSTFVINFYGVLVILLLVIITWVILFFDVPFGDQIRKVIHA